MTTNLAAHPVVVRAERASSVWGVRVLLYVVVASYAVVLIRTAWVCDDAYITLRTVDNFVHGYGLRWNPLERVQAYTHPLWMLLLSAIYALTRDAYFTALSLSLVCSAATVAIVVGKLARNRAEAIGAVLALTLSKAFMDYSTSGLENPLTHLLLAAFFAIYARPGVRSLFSDSASSASENRDLTPSGLLLLSTLAGLCTLNRMDVLLLVAPPLFWAARAVRPRLLPLTLGFLPFALWEAFAVVYYGSPWPNTAIAKLGGAVPLGERLQQGFLYLIDSAGMDPLTLMVIATAIVVSFMQPRREDRPIAVGIIASLTYVVSSGGDFMSGRQLAAPFFCAVLLLMRADWPMRRLERVFAVAVLIVASCAAPDPDLFTGASFKHDNTDRDGIVDERRVYYPYTGLLRAAGNTPMSHPWAHAARDAIAQHEQTVVWGANGFYGFIAGRHLDIVDKFALAEPLLARLPALPNWRPGHFERRIPVGYLESRLSGHNVISEPGVAALYGHVKTVTQGPLFTRLRFRTIWNLNTGAYDALLDDTSYGIRRIRLSELTPRGGEGIAEPLPRIHERGIEVDLEHARHAAPIELRLSGGNDYVVAFQRHHRTLGYRFVCHAWPGGENKLRDVFVQPPRGVREFDAILIRTTLVSEASLLGSVRVPE